MTVLFYLALFITSGQIVRLVPPSFSLQFFVIHILCVGTLSMTLALVARILIAKDFAVAWFKSQVWFASGVHLICMSWYFWKFDWPVSVAGVEPLNNSGTGFDVGIVLFLAGIAMSVVGGKMLSRFMGIKNGIS